jgi:hypothetical protein
MKGVFSDRAEQDILKKFFFVKAFTSLEIHIGLRRGAFDKTGDNALINYFRAVLT